MKYEVLVNPEMFFFRIYIFFYPLDISNYLQKDTFVILTYQ